MPRTQNFLIDQILIATNPFTVLSWAAGLFYFLAARDGKRYRLIGWMFVVPFVLFVIAMGRGYYMAPAYPMLFAAGAVLEERAVASLTAGWSRAMRGHTCGALAVGGRPAGRGPA